MSEASSRLLDLPWELRHSIIVHATRRGRKRAPIFNQKFIENRVRVGNCFDKDFPEATNFYVPRRRNQYLHGNGLRATNRQLRHEVDMVVEEELKSGRVDKTFVLDVMIVKDIGVFPCWMSFPYRPHHLKLLTIKLRIVRPGKTVVPNEWIEAAKYAKGFSYSNHCPAIRNIIIAISLYAFSCLSIVADPTQSDVVDAHLATSGQYVTDKLHIIYDSLEYDASGKPITSHVPDTLKESRFYEAGYFQFGREVFEDYCTKFKDSDELEDEADAFDSVEDLQDGEWHFSERLYRAEFGSRNGSRPSRRRAMEMEYIKI